jgi:hypothetical protein
VAFLGIALALLGQACAHHGEPFVPVQPGKAESTKVEETEDGHWTRKKSPYYVIKSVVVPRTRTLTIEPGVTVIFTKKGQNLTVDGRLIAVGKPESLITFRPTIPVGVSPRPGDWGSIIINTAGNQIAYARIQYPTTGLQVTDGNVMVDNLNVSNASADGIVVTRSSFTLRNSTVANNGQYGLRLNFCEDPFYSVLVEHCNIGYNNYAGIWSSYSTALITRSDVKNNGGGCIGADPEAQVFCGGAHFEGTPGIKLPVFYMCNLESNTPCDIRNAMVQDLVVTADSSYWGLTTTHTMNELSTPDPEVPPDKGNCDFNVRAICDSRDSGVGGATVHFCWWRDTAWPNFSTSAPSGLREAARGDAIVWKAPGSRWRS